MSQPEPKAIIVSDGASRRSGRAPAAVAATDARVSFGGGATPLEDHDSGDEAFARFASAADPALDARIAGVAVTAG